MKESLWALDSMKMHPFFIFYFCGQVFKDEFKNNPVLFSI